MTEQRHAALGIHAPSSRDDRRHAAARAQVDARARRSSPSIVLVLLALGAARTVVSRIANAHRRSTTGAAASTRCST